MNNFMSDRPGFYHDLTTPGPGGGSTSNNNNNGGGDDDSEDHNHPGRPGSSNTTGHVQAVIEREHMFDKVVTPSDVGKLNRLVIPKQHAEKYFPLDSSTNEKGLLLNFEDRNGKPWRFRYSYWNSSQSYVMTKGWSRFVKEKKLDAGDIVSFQRGLGEAGKDRLFIDWRRRPDAPDLLPPPLPHHFSSFQYRSGWNPLFLNPPSRDYSYSSSPYHHYHQQQNHHQQQHRHPYNYGGTTVVNGNPCPPGSIFYLRPGGQTAGGGIVVPGRPQLEGTGGGVDEQMVYESVPVVQGKAAAKRLRLFGVNMDCPIDDDQDETTTTISDECDNNNMSNATLPLHHYFPTSTTATTSMASHSPTSSPSIHQHQHLNSSLRLRPYDGNQGSNKGKGSMSLDLDI